MVPLPKKSRAGSFIERIKLLAARNSGKWGMTVKGSGFSLWDEKNVLKFDCSDGFCKHINILKPLNGTL